MSKKAKNETEDEIIEEKEVQESAETQEPQTETEEQKPAEESEEQETAETDQVHRGAVFYRSDVHRKPRG